MLTCDGYDHDDDDDIKAAWWAVTAQARESARPPKRPAPIGRGGEDAPPPFRCWHALLHHHHGFDNPRGLSLRRKLKGAAIAFSLEPPRSSSALHLLHHRPLSRLSRVSSTVFFLFSFFSFYPFAILLSCFLLLPSRAKPTLVCLLMHPLQILI